MLRSKSIRLKPIETADLPKLREWRNSPDIRPYTREYRPLNMLDQSQWLESLTNDKANIMFLIEINFKHENKQRSIGCCGLTHINWKEGHGEISIYIGEKDWQGKGCAGEALELLVKYGFEELRLHRIYAIIFEYNKLSQKFFEKHGFYLEGICREARFWDGKFYDEIIYGLLENEYREGGK